MVLPAEEGRLTTSSVRVLVATAVPVERDAVAEAFPGARAQVTRPGITLHRPPHGPDLLAAGVGPALAAASTAAALTAAALDGAPYALVVSAGIGGGFAPHAPVGSLVVADEITAADLGAETADGFLPVTELGFGTVTHLPPAGLVGAVAAATGARAGTVLTGSTVTGTAERAALLRARHPRALAEGMEGFGVAEAAAAHGVPVLELRAVSNPVGPRDRAAWRVGDALAALTDAFGKLAPVLTSWNPHDD
ncbi:futalosine hydrolase [Streptomyces rochei]|uniref:Futalosine hydrolase n=2 Tax=Streptomyces rochei group TaxID=2867164 RepID=A0AAX3ZKN2_STRRO|nr:MULTISPECIES: futalosine hydrolase [Streptomyces]WMC86988.1 futalosine hydrolase [Streptomyces rochei]GGZ76225.1 Futalosine hydrolase [Streptomyces plicatus]GHC19602.1 Futalosine hydrolase [Streptomyces vinaceusdrappus]